MLTAITPKDVDNGHSLIETKKQMANEKDNELIRNEDTLVRRAWIESAVEGVRAKVDAPLPLADVERLSADELNMAVSGPADKQPEPELNLVWDAAVRRSGT
ncbi:MAG: hypothetical protein ACR2QG_08590 [Gammaproteobacteria bacterium]